MGSYQKTDEKGLIDKSMPVEPDPFWPSGAAPVHLSKTAQNDKNTVALYTTVAEGEIWKCKKCGIMTGQSKQNKDYCHDCYATESQNSALAQQMNSNWMDEAKEQGLELFERQPEETDTEWFVWQTYRSYYPLKLPTFKELAERVGCSVASVVRASQRWSYRVRLVAWSQYTDGSIQEKRIAAIQEMNEKQLSMSKTIQEKLKLAIEGIVPEVLKPNEIVNLFKVATELERKVVTYVNDKVESTALESNSKQLAATKPEDLSEILTILQKTGLLEGKTIGIESATRVVLREGE